MTTTTRKRTRFGARTPAALERRFLYAIVDTTCLGGRDPAEVAAAMIAGGVDLIQVRAKDRSAGDTIAMARAVLAVARPAGIPVIVNDHPDLAAEVGADGVHVGQDDWPLARARAAVGRGKWVGKSTHSLEQALAAEAEGADYIGVGPVFATPTKPDYRPVGLELVRAVAHRVRIPFFCIGGIKLENAPTVIAAGGRRLVVVSGILQAPSIPARCRAFKELLLAAKRPARASRRRGAHGAAAEVNEPHGQGKDGGG